MSSRINLDQILTIIQPLRYIFYTISIILAVNQNFTEFLA